MQTSSLSKALYAPLLIGAVIVLYFTWEYSTDYAIYVVPFVLGFAIVYILSPQIDWWWWQRFPPKLAGPIVELFDRQLPFFRRLTGNEKTKFATRVALYLRGVEFRPQGMEAIPYDMQAVLAAAAVQVTFGKDDFLLAPFENIIVYPHPFPSPAFPEHWHGSELYEPDGVLLFSMEQVGASFANPEAYLHLPFYEYLRAFKLKYPHLEYPVWEADWSVFTLTGKPAVTFDNLQQYINLPPEAIDGSALLMALCMQFPEAMRANHPTIVQKTEAALGYRL